jgi:iron(III) transport system ATP-binding protein
MVFQSYALWPHMTVAANVGFGLDVRGVRGSESSTRIREALAAVRMEEYADRKPGQLSGGQQQRVALARALVIKPNVLLLDEPLSNLDAKLRIELRSEIRRICKASGITGIYVTHDQREALSMADRIAIMSEGRVVQVGEPKALYRRPTTRFVAQFLGEANVLPATRVGEGFRTAVGILPLSGEGRTDLEVCIRPEAIRLSPHNTGLSARVASATFLGEHTSLELAAGESVLHAIVPPEVLVPAVGENVHLSIRSEDCAVLSG